MSNPNVLTIQNGSADPVVKVNVEANIALVREHTTDYQPDFIMFSELSTTQYFAGVLTAQPFDIAEPIDGPTVAAFSDLARELHTYILLPMWEKGKIKGEYYNSGVVLDRQGELVQGTLPDGRRVRAYRKSHIPNQWNNSPEAPGMNEAYYFRPGPGLATFETEYGRIGILICYERSFPEAWRTHAVNGCKIVFLPTAAHWSVRAETWPIELRSSAMQNGIFICASNKGGAEVTERERVFTGGSMTIDPFGNVLAEAPYDVGPEAIKATLEIDQVEQWGKRYTFFRDRRPELYLPIVDIDRDAY